MIMKRNIRKQNRRRKMTGSRKLFQRERRNRKEVGTRKITAKMDRDREGTMTTSEKTTTVMIVIATVVKENIREDTKTIDAVDITGTVVAETETITTEDNRTTEGMMTMPSMTREKTTETIGIGLMTKEMNVMTEAGKGEIDRITEECVRQVKEGIKRFCIML